MNPLNTDMLREWAIDMAAHVAKLSKDPSTKVGAVIFDPKRRIVSAGHQRLHAVCNRQAPRVRRNPCALTI